MGVLVFSFFHIFFAVIFLSVTLGISFKFSEDPPQRHREINLKPFRNRSRELPGSPQGPKAPPELIFQCIGLPSGVSWGTLRVAFTYRPHPTICANITLPGWPMLCLRGCWLPVIVRAAYAPVVRIVSSQIYLCLWKL